MPPQVTSNFVGMSAKLMKIAATPPRTPAREEKADVKIFSKKSSPWKTSRRSSSKITPRESSPKEGSPEKTIIKEPFKKLSDGSTSMPLSRQLSLHSIEIVEDDEEEEIGEEVGLVVDEDELQIIHLEQLRDGDGDGNASTGRRREIPLSFIEAYCRDEDAVADSPHMGPYLLKLAKSYASGENPVKALEYCIRAVKFYERHDQQENVLDLVISLHILASLHCHLGQYEDAVALLERSLTIPDLERGGEEHALAAFSGHMQMGDTYNMIGKLAPSLQSYHRALDLQKSILGEFDARVAGTCVYIAEAHMQALEFAEAKELCEHSLIIHTKHCEPRSMEEAADYRLLAIIYSAEGEHNKALETLVNANDIYVSFEQEFDVATTNQSIGDELVALGRDSEAFVCFGKCVSDFKMLRGSNNAVVASAYTSLAELYLRINNHKEAKVYCQLALQIYAKQGVGHVPGDVAYGLVNIASILVQLNEKETALLLLKRAYNIQDRMPGQQATVAGLEAQIGILQNMLRQFQPALVSFQSAVTKMKNGTLRDSPLVGLVINQMGVTSIELGDVHQAARFFEEARIVMECTAGSQHLDTLDVCNNLACTYIHLGRTEDAKGLLEEVVRVKEEKLGTVHPDVTEDRARLQALLESDIGHVYSTTYKKPRKLAEMLSSARKAFHTSK